MFIYIIKKKIFILLYKMLSEHNLNIIEGVYIAIESKVLTKSQCDELISYVNTINNQSLAYLLWLLNRWSHLRKNEFDFPKRIKQFDQLF
jgi:pantothenate kinase